ncbi:hypothetical protein HOLleu_38629 [Holothuria leucospilota]|uniref:Uncharacterized protein n=1 Tax=Holothuria leucospilota TaxID=206669 RepID=A0A9Q0YJJ0_HOLLE|nr:hypothetical protein HOLleu_38629 [Holothuria leucospilota]
MERKDIFARRFRRPTHSLSHRRCLQHLLLRSIIACECTFRFRLGERLLRT